MSLSSARTQAPGQFVFSNDCPLDFGDAYSRLMTLSNGLASYVRTGTAIMEFRCVHDAHSLVLEALVHAFAVARIAFFAESCVGLRS